MYYLPFILVIRNEIKGFVDCVKDVELWVTKKKTRKAANRALRNTSVTQKMTLVSDM